MTVYKITWRWKGNNETEIAYVEAESMSAATVGFENHKRENSRFGLGDIDVTQIETVCTIDLRV